MVWRLEKSIADNTRRHSVPFLFFARFGTSMLFISDDDELDDELVHFRTQLQMRTTVEHKQQVKFE